MQQLGKLVERTDGFAGDCCISWGGLNRAGHVAVCQAAASNRPAMNAISPWTPGCLS